MIDNKNSQNSIKIFEEIYYRIFKSKLFNKLEEIRIVLCGTDEKKEFDVIKYEKCRIIETNKKFDDYEFPTLSRMKEDCDSTNENFSVLYLHLKGLTSGGNEWRSKMLDVVVDKHEECLSCLNEYHAAGTLLSMPYEAKGKFPWHFSGNFWWSTSKHIRNLPHPNNAKKDFYFLVEMRRTKKSKSGLDLKPERYIAEFWIGLLDMSKTGHKLKEIK